jgi:hypothetical protein
MAVLGGEAAEKIFATREKYDARLFVTHDFVFFSTVTRHLQES